jgi:hypothetical protein
MSMKNSIGNRTRGISDCSAVPQSTEPPLKENKILQRRCNGGLEDGTGGSVSFGDEADYGLLFWRFLTAHNVAVSVTCNNGEFSNFR